MFEIIGAIIIGLLLIFFAIAFTRGEPGKTKQQ
mgnify:CR=1 FL=1|jgi:hypothetical protein